jgi:hypothetical protein
MVLGGCSMNRLVADRTAAMLEQALPGFYEESDLALARDALPATLKILEGLQRASPGNAKLGAILAQGYCSFAFAFLEDSDNHADLERAKSLYWRGYQYGLSVLDEHVRRASTGTLDDLQGALAQLGKSDLPALFWTGYCLGNWVNLNKADVGALAQVSRAELIMHQVAALDGTFYHGGAHLFYAVYFGSRPRALGGDPQVAREHLEQAMKVDGGRFLMPLLFMAQFVAVPTQDQALFDASLKQVCEAPVDLMPSERLANQIAKKRAQKLQALRQDLF